ncbi:uncharacterized protein LOC110684081 [Chenopodium quinoa]|nr:uncharacterized protein LOC110684081 [Chenopodium quinoa]
MTILSGLGIVLSIVFGCLLLALVAELYYLLWWKKQRITSNTNNNSSNNRIQQDYSNHAKEMFYLFCWDKPTTINNTVVNPNSSNNNVAENTEGDIEMGLETRKDLLLKALGEEGVDSDIVRLAGHPRFLFTIKEETKEDLESEDGKSKASRKGSRTRSLSDLIMAIETHTPYNNLSPMSSSSPKSKLLLSTNNNNYNNPLFETSATVVEAEINRLRSSPPPKFKFLRDAEEKLYRRLVEEAQKSGIFQEVILENSLPSNYHSDEEEEKEIHCTSQVLQK